MGSLGPSGILAPGWGTGVRLDAGQRGAVAEQDRMAGGKRKRVETPPEVGDRVRVSDHRLVHHNVLYADRSVYPSSHYWSQSR
eukprot:COSAG02_NODE_659_length_18772_cov_14.955015_19_plen_83_part_00